MEGRDDAENHPAVRQGEKPPGELLKSASASSIHRKAFCSTNHCNQKVALAREAFYSSQQTFYTSPAFEGASARAARSFLKYASSLYAASHPLSS